MADYTPELSALSVIGGALLGPAAPVGVAAAKSLGFLSSVSLQPTGHLGFSQAQTAAVLFVGPPGGVWPAFQAAYTYDELQRIALAVVPRFDSAFANQWGTYTSMNQGFAHDIDTNGEINNALNNQLVVFMEWVTMNIDQARLQDEYNHVVPTYFDAIFIGAISDAGLDPSAMAPTLQKIIKNPTNPTLTPPSPTPTAPGAKPLTAGINLGGSSTLLLLGMIVGGYFLMKGKT